jgi:hypothetical protein
MAMSRGTRNLAQTTRVYPENPGTPSPSKSSQYAMCGTCLSTLDSRMIAEQLHAAEFVTVRLPA